MSSTYFIARIVMGESWVKQCMPRVSEVKACLAEIRNDLSSMPGVKSIRLFGSLADNLENPDYRVKDIDAILITPFHSEDLIAISTDILSNRLDILDEEGYDLDAVKFTRKIAAYDKHPIDPWVISSDKKLLHWGPIISDLREFTEIKNEAETYADKQAGFNLSRLKKADDSHRSNWFSSYQSYFQEQFKDMPLGWYCSEEQNVKDILSKAKNF